MAKPPPSQRELQILKVLWDIGPASVREVHERMCPKGELAFNTVQTLLRIMDEKGLVRHRRRGRTFIYSASYSRERLAARLLDQIFDGALDQFVLSLIKTGKPNARELDELQRIIEQARRQKAES